MSRWPLLPMNGFGEYLFNLCLKDIRSINNDVRKDKEMGLFARLFGKKKRAPVDKIEDFFVVIDSDAVGKVIAGKSQTDLKVLAVHLACKMWGKNDVMSWIEKTNRNRAVGFGGCQPLNEDNAMNWVKRNHSTSRYKSYLVKKGYISNIGKVILVTALNVSAEDLGL
jgi:hypothetical protein